MPKVQLTNRRHVFAEGPWFNVGVTEDTVHVRTDFGFVRITRRRKGLEVHVQANDTAEQFIDLVTPEGESTPLLGVQEYDIMLRPFGLVQMSEFTAENANPALHDAVEKWLARQPKKKEADGHSKT